MRHNQQHIIPASFTRYALKWALRRTLQQYPSLGKMADYRLAADAKQKDWITLHRTFRMVGNTARKQYVINFSPSKLSVFTLGGIQAIVEHELGHIHCGHTDACYAFLDKCVAQANQGELPDIPLRWQLEDAVKTGLVMQESDIRTGRAKQKEFDADAALCSRPTEAIRMMRTTRKGERLSAEWDRLSGQSPHPTTTARIWRMRWIRLMRALDI